MGALSRFAHRLPISAVQEYGSPGIGTSFMQRLRSWVWVQLAMLGAGLGASATLLSEYLSDGPSVCGVDGGCGEVRNSAFASIAGVPTPVLGVLFFGLLIALRAFPAPLRLQKQIATLGAVGALFFLAAQAWIVGAFCRYCIIVDTAALLYCALLYLESADEIPKRLYRVAAPLVFAGAFGLIVYGTADEAPIASNTALAVATEGRLTITEFVDFECPACRALHKELAEALQGFENEVDVVRRHMPLERHAHAREAARAYCCAEASGKGEEMADALFTAKALSASDCEDIAFGLGVPQAPYRACIEGRAPEATIAQDEELASEIGLRALPTFFVGTQRFEGVRKSHELVAAIERALAERKN